MIDQNMSPMEWLATLQQRNLQRASLFDLSSQMSDQQNVWLQQMLSSRQYQPPAAPLSPPPEPNKVLLLLGDDE